MNILGTLLYAGINAVILKATITPATCDFLLALETGFCGCLTTVSTFQHELFTLGLKDAYFYGGASVVWAQLLLLAINGGVSWSSKGPLAPSCLAM